MSYLTQPIQEQSLNGIISITDGSGLTIENGSISGLTNLDIGDNISCVTLSTSNIYGKNNNLNIGDSTSNIVINGSNIILQGPTVYVQSQTTQVLDRNVELNYNGNSITSVGSGITVLGDSNTPIARFQTDATNNWSLTSTNNKLTLGTLQSTLVNTSNVYADTRISTPYIIGTDTLFGNLSVTNSATIGTTSTDTCNVNASLNASANISFIPDNTGIKFYGNNRIYKKTGEGISVESTSLRIRDSTGAFTSLTIQQPGSNIAGITITPAGTLCVNKTSGTSGYYLDVNGSAIYNSVVRLTNGGANILQVVGGSNIGGDLFVGGTTNLPNITPSTSTSTGALLVTGGVGIGGNLNVGGTSSNITGNLQINQSLTVSVDASVVGNINNTGNTTTNNLIVNSTGSIPTLTSTSITSSNVGVSNTANIVQLNVTGTTDSTSTTSGSLQCVGGAGISQSLYVGGNINGLSNINITQNAIISGDTTTNNLLVNNNANIVGNVNVTGTNNTLTTPNIVANNGNISKMSSDLNYMNRQVSYASAVTHLNANQINTNGLSFFLGQLPFHIEHGTTATVNTSITITFDKPFNLPPTVLVSGFRNSATPPIAYIRGLTTTTVNLYAKNDAGNDYGSLQFTWLAIGN